MSDMGSYEVLSHTALPECSIRIIRMRVSEHVALHFHRHSAQVYTVLEGEVEVRLGEQEVKLRPYETVRIETGEVHSLRTPSGEALVMSLAIPPLSLDDQHVAG
ncbi:MAG TPA: cupin domain-containing protein [Dehalococcoidia bacterium]|nr:cupin domain-containing protein [Dehalococcoidia bacterium]